MEIKSLPVQNEDGDLVPCSSVAIYHLDSGELATIYDREGGVIENPIIAGADGIIEFSAPNGPYRAVLSIGAQQYQRFLYFSDIQEHNHSESAHPELSEFITSEANRAESAADLASLNSGIFEDTTAGLAATTEGDYFSVPSDAESEYLILYRHDAGPVATEIKRYPSSELVSAIQDRIPDDSLEGFAFCIADGDGAVALGVRDDGTAEVVSLVAETVTAGEIGTPSGSVADGGAYEFAISFADEDGFVSGGVKDDGTLAFEAGEFRTLDNVESVNGVPFDQIINPDAPDAGWPRPHGFLAEMNGIASYGQSLSIGAEAVPVISTTQAYDNVTFVGGPRSTEYTSLVPLIEVADGSLGETPASGTSQCIKELVLAEDGIAYTEQSYQLLGSAPGQGGTPISGLAKGTANYTRLLSHISNGMALADAEGKSYAFQAMTWMQGEADYSAATSYATYTAALTSLHNDMIADAVAVTEQPYPPITISYQVGSHLRYAISASVPSAYNAAIAQAQLDLSNALDGFYVACPMYQYDYKGTVNQVHLRAWDSKVVGAYFGLVYKRVVIDGEDWKPLQPTHALRSGRGIVLTMHVPVPPLVIDTAWVTENTDYGFRVFDSDNNQLAIDTVSILNTESVKILLAEAPPPGELKVDYALFSDSATGETGRSVGARGNIRDSQGDTIIFEPGGINRPLHNWLVMFAITV